MQPAIAKTQAGQSNWLVPAGLILLSFIPVVAGAFRITQLGGGAEITPENARFFASPFPVVLHILGVSVYSLLGAFQFAPAFRRSHPGWHRVAGRLLIPSGLIVAFTGLWMTHFYPWPRFDGVILYGMRLVVGLAMTWFLLLGAFNIHKRNFVQHGNWMTRAYALALGAGTQVFTHIPWLVFPSIHGEPARALCMGAGWVINLAVAEWVIHTRHIQATRNSEA